MGTTSASLSRSISVSCRTNDKSLASLTYSYQREISAALPLLFGNRLRINTAVMPPFISVPLGYNFEPPHTRIFHLEFATYLQHTAKLVRPEYSPVFHHGSPVYVQLEADHAMWRCDPQESFRAHYRIVVKELLSISDLYLKHWEGDFKLHSTGVSSEDAPARHYHRTLLAMNLGKYWKRGCGDLRAEPDDAEARLS